LRFIYVPNALFRGLCYRIVAIVAQVKVLSWTTDWRRLLGYKHHKMFSFLSASNCVQTLVELHAYWLISLKSLKSGLLYPYVEREKPSPYININGLRICSNYHHVTIVHIIQMCKIVLRLQNTQHSDMKLSLLLQYLSQTAQQSSRELDWYVHTYWIIVPLLGRWWVQFKIHIK